MTPPPRRSFTALCAALALSWAGLPAAAGAEPLRLATGGATGIYHALGSALCRLLEPDLRPRLDGCLLLSTDGSLDNLGLIRSGGTDLSIAQGTLVAEAVMGTGPFAEAGPHPDLRVLFAPLRESLAVVVRADDDVHQIGDLSGRRIDVGAPGSGSQAIVMRLIEAAGIDGVAPIATPPGALPADLLCAGASDAVALLAAHPHAIVQEALAACATRLVPLDDRVLERLLATHHGYRRAEIAPGHYVQIEAPVATLGTRAFVVADARLPDEIAYRLTGTVFEQLDELRRLHLAFADLDEGLLVEDCPPAPYHPGALAYLAEAGIELPECP